MIDEKIMIGNWFYSAEHGLPFQWSADDFKEIYNSKAKPIELSEDILIKCGFQKLSFNDGRHLFKLNEFYIEQRGLKFNRVEVNDAGNRIMYVGGKTTCDYVHQLQNLYYCSTGKELEITL